MPLTQEPSSDNLSYSGLDDLGSEYRMQIKSTGTGKKDKFPNGKLKSDRNCVSVYILDSIKYYNVYTIKDMFILFHNLLYLNHNNFIPLSREIMSYTFGQIHFQSLKNYK